MFGATHLIGFGAGGAGLSLIEMIGQAGLLSGLQLVLDAGDANSYAAGDKWLDRSGNGYDFFLGADGTTDGTEPTFNGTPGGLSASEYFSFDGGDYFTYDTTNEAWMNSLHKDNALYSAMAVVWVPDTAGQQSFFHLGTYVGIGSVGAGWMLDPTGSEAMETRAYNTVDTGIDKTADAAIVTGKWNMIGVTIDEATGAGGGFYWANGAYIQQGGTDTFNATYATPSAAAADYAMKIGTAGDAANGFLGNTARMACFAMWSGVALTKANLDALYALLGPRFGI